MMKPRFLPLGLLIGLLGAAALGQTNHTFVIATSDGPVITDADLIEYSFAEHAMKIQGESLTRLGQLAWMRLASSGKAFQVKVDDVAIYQGRFVPMLSSLSFKEPIILLDLDTNRSVATVIIHGPNYHEPKFQTGVDPRRDPRITQALAALGKLSPGVDGGMANKGALTARIDEILREGQQIKPGSKRADLLAVFTTEGGLSTATQRTFVHRDCPYIKVDVRFNLTSEKQSALEELPTDQIASISRPYLNWSIRD